jgi:hypothetical protein
MSGIDRDAVAAGSDAVPKLSRRPADRFAWKLVGVGMLVTLPVVLPPIFFPGGILNPSVLPALLIVPIGALVWVGGLLWSAVRLQWRRALSIAAAGIAFISVTAVVLACGDYVRFWAMYPYYAAKIARIPRIEGHRHADFWWSGGLGWDQSLVYDDQDSETDGPYAYGTQPGCQVSNKRLGMHFYASRLDCD